MFLKRNGELLYTRTTNCQTLITQPLRGVYVEHRRANALARRSRHFSNNSSTLIVRTIPRLSVHEGLARAERPLASVEGEAISRRRESKA